jgi:hypothetical protein
MKKQTTRPEAMIQQHKLVAPKTRTYTKNEERNEEKNRKQQQIRLETQKATTRSTVTRKQSH